MKPTFKEPFVLISEGLKLFRIKEVNIDTIKPEDQKEKDGITNDKTFTVKCAVEGGEEDGAEHTEFFPNHAKREFGLTNLAGLMIKTEVIPPTDNIDIESMRTPKFESKFKMSLPKRLFGATVKHVSAKDKDDPEKKYANLWGYLSAKEYNEKLESRGEGKGKDKGKVEKEAPNAKSESKEPEKDPWG